MFWFFCVEVVLFFLVEYGRFVDEEYVCGCFVCDVVEVGMVFFVECGLWGVVFCCGYDCFGDVFLLVCGDCGE